MTKIQYYVLAGCLWAGAACCGIAYAGLSEDGTPSPLLILGGLALVAIGVLLWRQPKKLDARRAARMHPLDAVVAAIARTRDGMLMLACFMGAVALLFVGLLIHDHRGTAGDIGAVVVMAVLSAGLAVLGAQRYARLKDPRHNAVMDLILERPGELAWIYMTEVHLRGQTIHGLHLRSAAGAHYVLRMEPEDIGLVMHELALRAPHAMRTYSRAAARALKQGSETARA